MIATLTIHLHLPGCTSLKEKRGRIKPLMSRLRREFSDRGHISSPLAGRVRPAPDQIGGRGLWVVNHVCELVQLRSDEDGTVVRVHTHSHR